MSSLTALVTGLTTGGLTCLAVQGGLLVGLLARREEIQERLSRWIWLLLPVAAFMVAKVVSHTLLGFGLGWLGDSISLSTGVRIWLQSFAALFMVIAGIRIIAPHWLPWLTLPIPAAARRLIRRSAKSQALIAPAVLGFLTILIPCGTTQAMELAAITTGSPFQAASIMFAFTLGTAPLFFVAGVLAKGTAFLQRRLAYLAATLVIGLGLYTFNGVLVAVDSPYEFRNVTSSIGIALAGEQQTSRDGAATSSATITVLPNGYSPNTLTVPANKPVTLKLASKGRLGCTSIFRIPKLNIETDVAQNTTTTVTAVFPKPGAYTFSCGMGMFRGTIHAV